MNILIFSWRDIKHPLAGGAEQVMHEHAKGWIKAGHTITHFSSRFHSSKRNEEIDGVKFIRSGYQYLGVQVAGFLFYIKNRNKFDLVVDEFHGVPFFTPLYVRVKKLAVVQEIAREVWFLNPLQWPVNWLIGIIGYITEPFVFLLYKKVPFMTGSNSAKEDITKMGILKTNISVVPHGVIAPKQMSISKEKKETILYLGKLSKDKGIEDALKCFSVLNKNRDFHFWVIGKAETKQYEKEIRKIVKQAKLDSKVKFWGFVSEREKFELLSKSHILINPSVREGWGLVNIEANSMGTPVVAYNSPGLIDSVKDGTSGYICKKNTPEDLALNVIKILNNSKSYKKLSIKAKKWARNFSWINSTRLSLKLIESMYW